MMRSMPVSYTHLDVYKRQVLNGHLRDGVMSKDVILRILGDIKADGGQYKSLEFTGPAAHEMSMEQRFTVANMALEAGAKCGLFEADDKTAQYLSLIHI